jgi:hypothetical protein
MASDISPTPVSPETRKFPDPAGPPALREFSGKLRLRVPPMPNLPAGEPGTFFRFSLQKKMIAGESTPETIDSAHHLCFTLLVFLPPESQTIRKLLITRQKNVTLTYTGKVV